MEKSVLFLLFLTTIQVESHWNTIGKCCAKNEMLITSESGDVNCTPIKNSEVEGLFYFGPEKPYLEACPENVTKIKIRNDFPLAFERVHCIDVLELNGPHRHVLTGLQLDRKCANKYRFISSFVSEVKKISEPLYLCCKANEKFDITTRKCVLSNVISQRKKINDVVQSLRGRSIFLTVYDGGILCPDVMVDYFVRPSDFFLGPNGIPKVTLNSSEQLPLSRDQKFCLDETTIHGTFILKLCRPKDYCRTNACIRKCRVYIETNESFYETRETIDSPHALIMRDNSNSFGQFKHTLLRQKEYGIIAPSLSQPSIPIFRKWQLLSNGYIQVSNIHESYNHDEYCLDFIKRNENDSFYSVLIFIRQVKNINNLGLVEGSSKSISFAIQSIILIIYVTSLHLDNLQTKFITSFLIGNVISDLLQAINILFQMNGSMSCSNTIYLLYFAHFFCFLWLTAMCYYGWKETKRNTYAVFSSARSLDDLTYFSKANFLIIIASALGTLMLVLLDHLEIMPQIIRPNCRDCIWFDKQYIYGKVIFYLIPMTVLLLLNTTYFVLTKRNLYYTSIDRHVARNLPNFRCFGRYELNKHVLYQNFELFCLTVIPFVVETGGEIISYLRPESFVNYSVEYYLVYTSAVVNYLKCFELFYSLIIKPKLCHSFFWWLKIRICLNQQNQSSNE